MIGTTHFTNAVVQRRDLEPAAVLRVCLPAAASLLPFCDWPGTWRRRSTAAPIWCRAAMSSTAAS